MKCLLLFLLSGVISLSAVAQITVTGHVRDNANAEPLPGAVLKVYSAGKLKSFGTAKSDGGYKLRIPKLTSDSLRIEIQCIGYSKHERTIANRDAEIDFRLCADTRTLREVKVEAPKINILGDTLIYNLSSYLGKSDVTLENGLKKLPGIDVEKSGKINYQGKGINNFYIEGMNMLGGKYNLATRNLPADYVTDVQVISNHHDAKIDRGRLSDNVALNIKLKSKVKFKPVGTSDVAAGYGGKWLYQLGGTGMLFTPSFQTMMTAKAGNIKSFSRDFDTDFIVMSFEGGAKKSLAEKAAGSLGGSTPPVSQNRYLSPRDRFVSLNFMKKLNDDMSLKLNTSYSYSAADYSYSQTSRYYAGDKEVVFNEQNTPMKSLHKPSLNLTYTNNSDNTYVRYYLSATAGFSEDNLMTLNNDRDLRQRSNVRDVDLGNSFTWRVKSGNKIWDIRSFVGFNRSPEADLQVSDKMSETQTAVQSLSSHSFNAKLEGATTYKFRSIMLGLPIGADYQNDHIRSVLSGTDDINNVTGNRFNVYISPYFEYIAPDKSLELRGSLSLRMMLLKARNHATDKELNSTLPYLQPNLMLKYIFAPEFSMSFNSSLSHSVGDILDLLTAPIMTSYRSRKAASGILAKNETFNSSLRFDYKKPFEFWFANASVSYTRRKQNILGSQYVTETDVTVSGLPCDNYSNAAFAYLSVTKQVNSIGGKFTLSGGGSWSKNEMMQQEKLISYFGQSLNFGPRITLAPWNFMELNYTGSFSKTFSRYLGIRDSYDMLTNDVRLSIYPASGWELSGGVEFIRKELSDGTHKSIALFDAGISFKHKSFKYALRADNLLDTRRYYYSIYNGLDKYSYSYRLRPRSITLSVTFTR